ncbi:MAG: hypothetical protein ACK518_03675 [bacterium]
MAQLKGDDLVLYAYEDLEPIGCEDSCIINLTAAEIITTTKGSGRSTNREYGAYDWNIQCTGVITLNEIGKVSSLYFNDGIIKGKKIAVKAMVGSEFYFGIGIVTSSSNTGTSGEFAKFDVTISGDGVLFSTNNLQNNENQPTTLTVTMTNTDVILRNELYNGKILMVLINNQVIDPSLYTSGNAGFQGFIDFTSNYTGTAKIYYIPGSLP